MGGERSNLTSGGEAALTGKSKLVNRTAGAAEEARKAMRFLKAAGPRDVLRQLWMEKTSAGSLWSIAESKTGFPIWHSSRDANKMEIRFGGLSALA